MDAEHAWNATIKSRTARAVAADWFEDKGEISIAFALRWAAGWDRCPKWYPEVTKSLQRPFWLWEEFGWFQTFSEERHRLPVWLLPFMPGFSHASGCVRVASLKEAWTALANALDRVQSVLAIRSPLADDEGDTVQDSDSSVIPRKKQ